MKKKELISEIWISQEMFDKLPSTKDVYVLLPQNKENHTPERRSLSIVVGSTLKGKDFVVKNTSSEKSEIEKIWKKYIKNL